MNEMEILKRKIMLYQQGISLLKEENRRLKQESIALSSSS
jgi:hypothetical protein